LLIKKDERVEGLVLRTGHNITICRQVSEEVAHLQLPHFLGVPLAMVKDELANPHPVGILSAEGVLAKPANATDLIFQPRLGLAGRSIAGV
jgi:hypothetical protein